MTTFEISYHGSRSASWSGIFVEPPPSLRHPLCPTNIVQTNKLQSSELIKNRVISLLISLLKSETTDYLDCFGGKYTCPNLKAFKREDGQEPGLKRLSFT